MSSFFPPRATSHQQDLHTLYLLSTQIRQIRALKKQLKRERRELIHKINSSSDVRSPLTRLGPELLRADRDASSAGR